MSDELAWMQASSLAEKIDQGEVSATEVIKFALARIESFNPELNAVVACDPDLAMENAERCVGRLGGVPMLVDDLTPSRGLPCSFGGALWEGNVAENDSYLVTRYRHAGLNILGKSNVSELGVALSTESQYLGVCSNPWDPARSPGGGCGGAAVAVASGMVPIAQATDFLGGLRISAASCGLVGLKPTRARTPLGPDDYAGWSGLASAHVLTRSVLDSALCLESTMGPALGDPYLAPPGNTDYHSILDRPPGPLRIAVDLQPMNYDKIAASVRTAIDVVCDQLEALGHEVTVRSVDYDRQRLGEVLTTLVVSEVRNRILGRSDATGIPVSGSVMETCTLSMVEAGAGITGDVYVRAMRDMYRSTLTLERFFADSDLILTPTTKTLPPPLGHLDTTVDADTYVERAGEFSGFTSLFNLSGHPAISLPLYWTDDDMPVGIQFAAPFGREDRLLQLAMQLEEAMPWIDRRPGMFDEQT